MSDLTVTISSETFEYMADRIEELIAERDQAWKRAAHAEEMWGRAEVKLSETTYALKRIASNEFAGVMLTSMPPQDAAAHFARTTLAELTGGNDG